VLGTQRVEGDPARTVDGVFALWYGKGPGVDRAGDALKHGNAYGASPNGGVLVVAGDDHGAVSSSMPFQSDLAFLAWSMPVVHPASVAEYVPFGLWSYALSRSCGAWVGFKAMSEVVESAASVELQPPRSFSEPSGFAMPPGGLHQRWPDLPSPRIEERLLLKLAAARAFRAHQPARSPRRRPGRPAPLDRHGRQGARRRDGGVASGRPSPERLSDAGVAVLKIGLVHPLETSLMERLAERVDEILVVEEKAPVVERQLKEALYNAPRRPRIVGKADETGAPLIAEAAELRPSILAPMLAARLARLGLTLDSPDAQRAPLPPPEATRAPSALTVLLLRLPAQHLDARSGGLRGARRHRLPFHGGVDGPLDGRHRSHGRRGRRLDRPGAVHRHAARLPEPRRRHLLPLRPSRDPAGRRRRRQRHLQDPLQRRRRDDGRAAHRRRADRAADHAARRCRGREAHRRRVR
jgi:indolepyruvate ferredoxin oxidoreductase